MEILCQVAWNYVKGIQKPTGNERKQEGEHISYGMHVTVQKALLSRSEANGEGNIQPAQVL